MTPPAMTRFATPLIATTCAWLAVASSWSCHRASAQRKLLGRSRKYRKCGPLKAGIQGVDRLTLAPTQGWSRQRRGRWFPT